MDKLPSILGEKRRKNLIDEKQCRKDNCLYAANLISKLQSACNVYAITHGVAAAAAAAATAVASGLHDKTMSTTLLVRIELRLFV